jgi:hypothetical protein
MGVRTQATAVGDMATHGDEPVTPVCEQLYVSASIAISLVQHPSLEVPLALLPR